MLLCMHLYLGTTATVLPGAIWTSKWIEKGSNIDYLVNLFPWRYLDSLSDAQQ